MKQTAHTLSNAVRRAEKELQPPHETDALVIDVRPSDVETRIQLFQPRMLTHGGHLVDAKHVKKLSRTIGTKGELEPILVVKLRGSWVCVDGQTSPLGSVCATQVGGDDQGQLVCGNRTRGGRGGP
jgi:hypothetical protein